MSRGWGALVLIMLKIGRRIYYYQSELNSLMLVVIKFVFGFIRRLLGGLPLILDLRMSKVLDNTFAVAILSYFNQLRGWILVFKLNLYETFSFCDA